LKFNKDFSSELQYDLSKANIGMFGLPAFGRFGYSHKFSDKTSTNVQINCGKHCFLTNKWNINILPELKLTLSERVNLCTAFTKPTNADHTFGMAFEYSA